MSDFQDMPENKDDVYSEKPQKEESLPGDQPKEEPSQAQPVQPAQREEPAAEQAAPDMSYEYQNQQNTYRSGYSGSTPPRKEAESPVQEPPKAEYTGYNMYQQRPAYQQADSSGNYQQRPYSSQPYGYNNYAQQNPAANGSVNGSAPSYQQAYGGMPPVKKKKSKKGKKVLAVLLALIVIGASLGVGAAIGKKSGGNNPPTTAQVPVEDTTGETVNVEVQTCPPAVLALSGTEIAEKVRQSVVGIMAYQQGELAGEGSGVVLCEDGSGKYTYITTCAHVISDKGLEFSVLTLDGNSYDAHLVGYDERTDIGVLRLDGNGLTAASFGDSSALKIGETVYAIGNPGGSEYFGSMTSGIVSAIDRSISSTYNMKVIQHDAAINPGNSGGALVNTAGQVIGINSSKIADTDYEGMGFAVPMSTAKSVSEALISHGYVPNRPKLGIQYSDVSNYQFYTMLVRIKELPQGSLIISKIAKDSDFVNTKAQVGDLIIAVNGNDMDTADVLLDLIEESKVGDTLKLTLCRVDTKSYKTSTFDVEVKLVEDKGTSEYGEEEETTTGGFQFGGNDAYSDFFNRFFGDYFGEYGF